MEATKEDFDFDGRDEIRLANDRLVAWFSPWRGGSMYELDLRDLSHNLLATIQRRPESYHQKVRAGQNRGSDETSSIHDRVVFKQEGLEQRLGYDQRLRKNLIDHYWDDEVDLSSVADGVAWERGDFADGPFEATTLGSPECIQVQLKRSGNAWGVPLTLTKSVTLKSGEPELGINYLIEGIPAGRNFHFGVEFNFAGMPADQKDRFFSDADGRVLGHLGSRQDLHEASMLELNDRWLGLRVAFSMDRPGGIWTYPVQTVSQSESGFELIHQSLVVQPHWQVHGDRDGSWATGMTLSFAAHSSDNQKHVEQMLALS